MADTKKLGVSRDNPSFCFLTNLLSTIHYSFFVMHKNYFLFADAKVCTFYDKKQKMNEKTHVNVCVIASFFVFLQQ